MKSLSPTQHACLDAMGIDVWVSRDELLDVESAKVVVSIEPESDPISESLDTQATHAENITVDETTLESEPPPVEFIPREIAPILDIPADWNGLRQAVSNCQRCELHLTRTQTVFGAGSQNADWLIIGDTPTVDDDKDGNPFAGLSGELLTAMLRAIKLTRQHVYVTNTLKCLTPNNREPEAVEIETCVRYLYQQIKLIKPKLILIMGQSAAQRVLNNHSTLARLRQKIHTLEGSNIPVIVTYHPASLLSMPANKSKAWQDLLLAQKTISAEAVL